LRKFFKKNIKIGILGGTFDPPHKGHLHISKIALTKLRLNKILWIVAKRNPLKQKPYLKIKTRVKLAQKITNKNKKIFVQHFSNKIISNNTFNSLNYLKKKHKNAKLFFLIGADNLIKFHKWNNWKEIPKLAKIVVFPRGNHLVKKNKYTVTKSFKKKDLIYINSKKVNISSSLIRKFW
tara:strand:+ start:1252 stop:1788 length:537 start_codon:yes stop_codon:yes gene_type:complete